MACLAITFPSATAARRPARRGFGLIELVIVVVIIGIIAAIAIPRMSRGSQGAADSALAGNLSVLRNAVDLYQTEASHTPDRELATFLRYWPIKRSPYSPGDRRTA